MNTEELLSAWKQEVAKRSRKWENNAHVRAEAEEMAKWYNQEEKWLAVLSGNVGTGKTTLMHAIQSAEKKRIWNIFSAKELAMITIKEPWEILRISAYALVGLDDVGAEPEKLQHFGNDLTPVADFIEVRYRERKKTIITTNLKFGELGGKYGERIESRLAEMAYPILFSGEDFRKK